MLAFSHEKLAKLRHARGLSRSALHRELVRRGHTLCRSLVNKWELARSIPSANDAWMLALVLEVPIADLFVPDGIRT